VGPPIAIARRTAQVAYKAPERREISSGGISRHFGGISGAFRGQIAQPPSEMLPILNNSERVNKVGTDETFTGKPDSSDQVNVSSGPTLFVPPRSCPTPVPQLSNRRAAH